MCRAKCLSFLDIIYRISQSVSVDELCLFCVLACAVWGEICHRKHDVALIDHPIVVSWASALISEFQLALHTSPATSSVVDSNGWSRWFKPLGSQLRLNVDASFNDQKGWFSNGAMVRDIHGNIKAAIETKIRNPGSALKSVLLVILSSMQFCVSNDFVNV